MAYFLISSLAYAQEAASTAKGPSTLELLIMPLGFILIIYFFIILPQKRKAKEHQNLLTSLKSGDEVITSGGIIGKVKSVSEGFISVDIAPNTTVKFQKHHIAAYSKPKDAKAPSTVTAKSTN